MTLDLRRPRGRDERAWTGRAWRQAAGAGHPAKTRCPTITRPILGRYFRQRPKVRRPAGVVSPRVLLSRPAEDLHAAAYLDRHVEDLGLAFRLTGDEQERAWPLNPMPIFVGAEEWA